MIFQGGISWDITNIGEYAHKLIGSFYNIFSFALQNGYTGYILATLADIQENAYSTLEEYLAKESKKPFQRKSSRERSLY